MTSQNQISRNTFLRIMSTSIFVLTGWIWYRISGFQDERDNRMEFRHGNDLPMGISYFEKYYLIRTKDSLRAFSTTCTHAGCRISKSSGTKLQCNCHGSQFEAETGKALKGPALKSLPEFECRFDEQNGQWVVRLVGG